jgi:hypothetical protein
MATDKNLYTVARAQHPTDVEAAMPNLEKLVAPLVLLNGRTLRERIERFINRSLLWEEWLDVRRDWCMLYHAYHCDAVLGDSQGVERCGQIGRMQGCQYVLLEVV